MNSFFQKYLLFILSMWKLTLGYDIGDALILGLRSTSIKVLKKSNTIHLPVWLNLFIWYVAITIIDYFGFQKTQACKEEKNRNRIEG